MSGGFFCRYGIKLKVKPETLLIGSIHKKVPETITITTSDSSRVKASTPSEVAELFNHYFVSVFVSDQETPVPER